LSLRAMLGVLDPAKDFTASANAPGDVRINP
jgi:hypothetical protein